jgi:hypothetical protein
MVGCVFFIAIAIIMMKGLTYNSYTLGGIIFFFDIFVIWNFIYVLIHPTPPKIKTINDALSNIRTNERK